MRKREYGVGEAGDAALVQKEKRERKGEQKKEATRLTSRELTRKGGTWDEIPNGSYKRFMIFIKKKEREVVPLGLANLADPSKRVPTYVELCKDDQGRKYALWYRGDSDEHEEVTTGTDDIRLRQSVDQRINQVYLDKNYDMFFQEVPAVE